MEDNTQKERERATRRLSPAAPATRRMQVNGRAQRGHERLNGAVVLLRLPRDVIASNRAVVSEEKEESQYGLSCGTVLEPVFIRHHRQRLQAHFQNHR